MIQRPKLKKKISWAAWKNGAMLQKNTLSWEQLVGIKCHNLYEETSLPNSHVHVSGKDQVRSKVGVIYKGTPALDKQASLWNGFPWTLLSSSDLSSATLWTVCYVERYNRMKHALHCKELFK